MVEGRRGKVHGKRLPDGTYELLAFVDGVHVTHAFLHEDGARLIKARDFRSLCQELLLFAQETTDGTLICSISDVDRFIDTIGMTRLDVDA